ncbi:1-phosphofructokinase [Thalassobacillus devorans]|uniref:1-phosphofructokinase n=1 Tax=Thalassobacillus devorans TaxID=279813 RepID=UPI00048C4CD4|nr:1-phosphofructokinase [Thalassobacillus devorans]
MIYTCTLNPSIDYIMHVSKFEPGGLNRAEKTFYYPGGKGINVSRVLNKLSTPSTALGFAGGFTGQFIRSFLDDEGVSHHFIETGEPSRINVKMKAGDETEINGPGPSITTGQQRELLSSIEKLSPEDTLVIAGSVPSSLDKDIYLNIADICKQNNISLVADTSGEALQQLIGSPVMLLKPNHHELGQLFETTVTTKDDAVFYAKKLVEQGAENVIVSMGGDGAVLVDSNHALHANVPQGQVKNSVGAGDSVVAGFLAALSSGKNLEAALRYGVAAGSATAFNDDLCNQKEVDGLLNDIDITGLN